MSSAAQGIKIAYRKVVEADILVFVVMSCDCQFDFEAIGYLSIPMYLNKI